jgi:DNA primase
LCREFNVPVKDGLPQGYAKRGTPRRKPASEDTARKRETPEEICEVYEDLLERCPLTPEAIAYGEGREWTRTLLERFGIVAIDNPEKLYRDLLDEHGTESLKAAGLINRADRFHFERHRLIFPFYSRRSFRVEYLQARRIEGNEEPRYMGAILGGQDRLMPCLWNDISLSQLEPGSEVHICEGIPDALTLEAAGLRALACLGVSNLSEDFIKDLLRFDVVLAADRDEQGTRFNEEAAERFGRYGVRVSVSQPPEGFKDWNEYRNRGKQE